MWNAFFPTQSRGNLRNSNVCVGGGELAPEQERKRRVERQMRRKVPQIY